MVSVVRNGAFVPLRDELARLARLAWPVVIAHVGLMLMGVVDTIMVSRYSAQALAGVALGHTWSFGMIVLLRGAAMGLDPLLTQAHGARDDRAFARSQAHGLVLVTLLAVPLTAAHGVAGPVLGLLDQPPAAVLIAQAYAWAVAPSVWAMGAEGVLRQGLQARGIMHPTLWVAVVGNVLNVPANYLLIYGFGDFAGLGPAGAGWATSVVRWGMLLAMVGLAWPDVVASVRGLRRVTLRRLAVIAGLALPVSLQVGLEVWGFSLGTLLAGWFGEEAVAAHTVALNIASLAFMVPHGIATAASTRVGNLLGAGLPWQLAGRTALVLGVGVMTLSGMVFVSVPEVLVGLYVRPEDAAVLALAAALLPIAGGFQLFDGFQVVAFGVLRGAGDTFAPSVANVAGFYLIGLPLAAYLSWELGWGVMGIWLGLTAALATVSMLLLLRLRHVEAAGGFRRAS